MTIVAQERDLSVGDFVLFVYSEDQKDKARIVKKDKNKDDFIIEICLTKKKSENIKTERFPAKRSQLCPLR